MASPIRPRRLVLLLAALLSACGAAEAPGSAAHGRSAAAQTGQPEPSGAFGAYLAGRFAFSETDTGVAADRLLEALRLDPDQPELLSRAFLATVLDGRPEAQRLARRLPDNQVASLLLIGAEVQAGRWDRAEQRLRAVPRQGPAQILQPILLAWVQQGRGATDEALATLRPLAEGGRLRGLHAFHAALIADLAGRPREAEHWIRAALADSPEPTLRLLQLSAGVLARAGREADAGRLVDQLERAGGDLSLAGGPAQRRRMLSERGVASAVEGVAEAHLALAAALRAQGAPEPALVLTRLALRLRPNFSPALLLAAEALADARHPDTALTMLDRIPADDALARVAALRRAGLLDQLDRTDQAEALLRRLAAEMPQAWQPMARLGDILRGRSRFAEAAAVYDHALARVPNPGPDDWPLLYARGISYERAGQWPRAEADFLRALELAPDQPYVLNYLAYAWVEQGRNLSRARAMLERAVELRPSDGHIVDSLGWALFKLNDLPGAIRWLERAVELEPRNSIINDHLGDAYWAAGRQREAQFQWRRALALDPEPDEAPKIEAKLREGLPGLPASTAHR